MDASPPFDILVVEPAHLLRRTVALTVRSLGTARVTEAPTYPTAHQLLERRAFDGAVIALDWPAPGVVCEGLTLVHRIRAGEFESDASIPITLMVDACDAGLLQELRGRQIHRILIKPFRARDVIDTIATMRKLAASARLQRGEAPGSAPGSTPGPISPSSAPQ